MSKLLPSYVNYWESDVNHMKANNPIAYSRVELNKRSQYLNQMIERINKTQKSEVIDRASKILELGCNCGRNLNYLCSQNYTNLYGIEINKNAIETGKSIYPQLFKTLNYQVGRCQDVLPEFNNHIFDLIYTMAVLMHIDDSERNQIYDFISTNAKYLICIEPDLNGKEVIKGGRMFNRPNVVEEMKKRKWELISIDPCPVLKNYKTILMKNVR